LPWQHERALDRLPAARERLPDPRRGAGDRRAHRDRAPGPDPPDRARRAAGQAGEPEAAPGLPPRRSGGARPPRLLRGRAPLISLDPHVVLWLYGGRVALLPGGVQDLLRQQDLLISPMVVLEMQYLFELQRTSEPAATVLAALSREIGLEVCDLPFFA